MNRELAFVVSVVLLGVTVVAADDHAFTSVWKAPAAEPFNYTGRGVAALVIVDNLSVEMSAEEALAREITARGPVGIAAYRIVPREEMRDRDKAKAWFDRRGIAGVVAMRVVGKDTEHVYSSVIWTSGVYGNAWDYYAYGWAQAYPIGAGHKETTFSVETMLFDVATASPIWAGVSSTTDPKDIGSFMKELAKDLVKELQKSGLMRKGIK